jgi:hypothetical protein
MCRWFLKLRTFTGIISIEPYPGIHTADNDNTSMLIGAEKQTPV